ncbi:MAG: inositol monophosphatase [Rhodospirillales bacterium]|nr:inositol monophosphatase [Rhodospirillales bacterium]MCB9973681.1 inositol monophosphatase [Rhodospirillales bacterium]
MSHRVSPYQIEQIIRELSAEHIIPRFRHLREEEIMTKSSPTDLVTAADIEMEEALIPILADQIPGSFVLGEEMVSRGAVDLDRVIASPPEYLWVVDPVDGTWNFAHGSEIFACMVALLYRGEPVMSWIYNVMKDEFAVAEKGQGASYAGHPLRTAPAKPLESLHGYVGRYYAPKEIRKIWEEKEQHVATVGGIKCVAHSYLRIARGVVDFHIYAQTKPWDHLAGDLLVREAGGAVKRWNGSPYHISDGQKGLLIASGEEVWENIQQLFLRELL